MPHPIWIVFIDKLGAAIKGIGTLLQQTAEGFRKQKQSDAEQALREKN